MDGFGRFGHFRSYLVGFGRIWSESVWVWSDSVRLGCTWSGSVGFDQIWSDSIRFGRIKSDLVRFGRIMSDSVRCGQIWSDLGAVAPGRGP